MEFNRAYNRETFMKFLEVYFLPQDFIKENTPINITTKTSYIQEATKLGVCSSLDLVVYEVKHSGKHDPRVGLSKESFKLLAQEWQGKALIAFVPMDSDANYRFSYISIDLDITEQGKIKKSFSNPRRYSYFLGDGIACHTPNKYLNSGRVKDTEDLQSRFSVEVLTKAFYNELSDWYAWAITVVKFPNDINDDTDDEKYNTESVIRLITRLMFVWFIKQKNLVPKEFFEESYIRENLLANFNPNTKIDLFHKSEESKYYKAILQNLFFAMLNSPISPEGKEVVSERRFANGRNDYNNNKLMRYKDKFLNPDLFVELANGTVPFLNGGLFDCLDDKDKGFYIDGFSQREKVQKALVVPDYLFFGEEVGKNIDLSGFYGDKKKSRVSASGIIDILKRYNFTVEENTPFDQDVSLDPELLGKVFENLLASYNPETKTTARKQTGSFYTPREIVQYMVDESLVAHLKRTVGEELEEEYRSLMRYTDEEINLSDEQKRSIIESLYECKVLDPACGSGAFPVGILQQMVHILTQLDPDNTSWKELLLARAVDETTEAFKNISSEEREAVIKDINHSFDEKYNNPDYSRKLYLIENCIYGVDIQSIAIQISKLRFFISLVVDQKITGNAAKNFGIRPLPNLEAKFVAANTLIGLNKSDNDLFHLDQVKEYEKELLASKKKLFSVKDYRAKRNHRNKIAELRIKIAQVLLDNNIVGVEQSEQLASWDMFDQNASSPFFDPEWMFGIHDGFDIVIANPPFISYYSNTGSTLSANTRNYYVQAYQTVLKQNDRINSMNLMLEKGVNLLAEGGILTFITNKTIAVLPSYIGTRQYVLNNCKLNHLILDLSPFEAIVDCVVFGLSKTAVINNYTFNVGNQTLDNHEKRCRDEILKNRLCEFKFSGFDSIINKMRLCKNGLSDLLVINRGVNIGGCFDVFLSDNQLTTQHKAYIPGTAYVKKYIYAWDYSCGYMLFDEDKERELKLNGKTLALGQKSRYEQERLYIPESGQTLMAAYCNDHSYSAYGIMVGTSANPQYPIKYACALLNSKLITLFAEETEILRKGNKATPHVGVKGLRSIPINIDDIQIVNSCCCLVDKILEAKRENPQADTSALEAEIDQMVYTLYNLTPEEINLIENR